MNALAIVEAATADGLVVDLSPTGSLKAIGEQEAVNRWRPVLKQHRAEIINLLSKKPGGAVEAARPRWCRTDCPGLETLPLAGEGDVAGCVNPVTGTWRRLAWMGQCPATEALVSKAEVSKMVSIKQVATERQTVEANALSEWCGTACEHFHQAEAEYCCREIDGTHWRRDRIDTMKSCPRIGRI